MKYFVIISFFTFAFQKGFAQIRTYYSVPEIKHYFTYYKNNVINEVFDDSTTAFFNKYSDSAYSIFFFSNKKLLTKCDCIFRGKITKQYAMIARSSGGTHKIVRDSFMVKHLILRDTLCLKLLPRTILSQSN